ncbi:peptidoglycan-binding protein [Pelagibacterium lacus]|uniref:Peptidoglycan-binding protein n=2 Tax=Pelagibacterium lacus TaxID=2282655 RepID=A0A369W1W7_9HYPH|nr:peptidoglycan-binding protein [Pelagibacterium lacus]
MVGTPPVRAGETERPAAPAPSSIEALCRELSAAAAWAEDWQCVQTRIFEDNPVQRSPVVALRERAETGEQLEPVEQAILAAAPRAGIIVLCNGQKSGNAFLIRHDGHPAVVTSAHMLTDSSGQLICSASDLRISTYMPNVSYFDDRFPDRDKDFVLREVGLVAPPINLEETEATRERFLNNKLMYGSGDEDYVIFYLAEDITGDVMPDGSVRGHLEPALSPPESGNNVVLMGMAADILNGLVMVHQHTCRYHLYRTTLSHTCDTLSGTSGSLVAAFFEDELLAFGVHNAAFDNERLPEAPVTPGLWNTALHVAHFLGPANEQTPRPELLAFDIQFELKQAGCYTGALDNQWGPGSRDALSRYAEASGLSLDGLEPTQETFDLLRDRRPQGQICSG